MNTEPSPELLGIALLLLIAMCVPWHFANKLLHAKLLPPRLEKAVIELLTTYNICAESRRDAPGVYVDGKKIAALGLRVRKGCSYHGLSLNVDMDLEPFGRINPCGHEGLEVTSMAQCLPETAMDMERIGRRLMAFVSERLA